MDGPSEMELEGERDPNEGAPIAAKDVRRALKRGELFLEYLPLMAVPEGRCVGAEALARWRRDGGVVMPNRFIPAIEETPVSGLLTYWVIETLATELGEWLRAHDDVQLGINIPPEILGRGGLEYAAERAGLLDQAPKLVLEITERGYPDRQGAWPWAWRTATGRGSPWTTSPSTGATWWSCPAAASTS